MEIKEEKRLLRQQVRQQMAALPEQYVQSSDAAIVAQIVAHPLYQAAQSLFCFVGVGREINTRPLIEQALAAGKVVAVPRCLAAGQMECRCISSWDELRPARFGLLEPGDDSPLLSPGALELVIVPCLSADQQGYRLGQGGGFYDRFLAACAAPGLLVARQRLLLTRAPREAHDLRLPYLVTETGVFATAG